MAIASIFSFRKIQILRHCPINRICFDFRFTDLSFQGFSDDSQLSFNSGISRIAEYIVHLIGYLSKLSNHFCILYILLYFYHLSKVNFQFLFKCFDFCYLLYILIQSIIGNINLIFHHR